MHRSTAFVRRACAVGTATALVGLTTGLGVMTATTAYAADGTGVSTPTVVVGDTTSPAAPTLPTDAGTPVAGTGTTAPTAGATGSPTPAAGGGTPAATPAPATPVTSVPTAGTEPSGTVAAAATGTVTVSGAAKVGGELVAKSSGFTKPTSFSYLWSVGGVATTVDDASYVVQPGDVEKVVSVTVTNRLADGTTETATASSAPVTQEVVLVDADGEPVTVGLDPEGEDFELTATAGEPFSYTFRATGSPKPTFSLDWYEGEFEDDDETVSPASQLPEGFTFDTGTGVLSGSSEAADETSFAITATNGTSTTTQYVDLTIDAAAAAGIEVYALDRAEFMEYVKTGSVFGYPDDDAPADGTLTSWIIDARGGVTTEVETYHRTVDGFESTSRTIPGGRPTVDQGGTLLVNGNLVDRFDNFVFDDQDEVMPVTVTSDVASDVVTEDPDFGDFTGFVDVTFPHASTHHLTATSGDFATTFAVQVNPAAAPPVTAPVAQPIGTVPSQVVTGTRGHRLAYTGTDTTGALPWALGMLAAGAALVGARVLRRRTALTSDER